MPFHNESHNSMKQSTVKALPKRLSISIGGHFGPCYSVTLKKVA
jgi:hypothetical protein